MKRGLFPEREREMHTAGQVMIGIDEVGRGCLAGPVVAAAVFFDWEKEAAILALAKEYRVMDSKCLSAREREAIDAVIRTCAFVGVGCVESPHIDEINILQATFEAMRQAVQQLEFPVRRTQIWVDGPHVIPGIEIKQEPIVDGDAKIFSIAAASIVAKVARDKLMTDRGQKYPVYLWEKNKGYGTKEHREAILKYGLSPEHRRTFCDAFLGNEG